MNVPTLLNSTAELVRTTETGSADAEVLDAAVHDLAEALAELHAGLEVCVSPGDGWGYCSDCGARLERTPHKRGGDGCISGLIAPVAALAAFWRRLLVRLAPPPTREDQT